MKRALAVAFVGLVSAPYACADSGKCESLRDRIADLKAEAQDIGAVSWDEAARIQDIETELERLAAELALDC